MKLLQFIIIVFLLIKKNKLDKLFSLFLLLSNPIFILCIGISEIGKVSNNGEVYTIGDIILVSFTTFMISLVGFIGGYILPKK